METVLIETFKAKRGVIGRPGGPTASHALAMARAALEKGKQGYGRPHPSRAYAQSKKGLYFVDNPAALGFRHVGDVCAELSRWRSYWQTGARREGFISDPFGHYARDGDGLVWGAVYQLPARKGVTQFVAGFVWGHEASEGVTLDLSTIWKGAPGDNDSYSGARDNPAAHDAAREANRLAESAAESERDYQAAWQCGRAYQEAREEIADARESLRALLRERRQLKAAKGAAPSICAAIESTARRYLETIKKAREEMRDALEGRTFDLYADLRKESHINAFCEAAGLESFPA